MKGENQKHFAQLLSRTFGQVKKDRAENILENAEIAYRRHIEDLKIKIKKTERQLENNLDYSPTTAGMMISVENFDENQFVFNDVCLIMDIRDLTIELEQAEKRYKYLFE
jgi:hypothetical protein